MYSVYRTQGGTCIVSTEHKGGTCIPASDATGNGILWQCRPSFCMRQNISMNTYKYLITFLFALKPMKYNKRWIIEYTETWRTQDMK